jgi:flagellar hook-basal body complex protein FliE
MTIPPVGASGVSSVTPISTPTLDSAGGTSSASGPSFQKGLDAVSNSIADANTAATQVATGTATDLHTMTIAATKAQLGVEMTVAFRDKAVEAYQDVMRMSV